MRCHIATLLPGNIAIGGVQLWFLRVRVSMHFMYTTNAIGIPIIARHGIHYYALGARCIGVGFVKNSVGIACLSANLFSPSLYKAVRIVFSISNQVRKDGK